MYRFVEISAIFKNCEDMVQLNTACAIFIDLIQENCLDNADIVFIRIKSTQRFRELENLQT